MKIKIDKEIIQKTTKCTKNFDCLTNSEHIYCQVLDCVNDEIHFVECLHDEFCSYKIIYGDSCICCCPARKEIYNKYRK